MEIQPGTVRIAARKALADNTEEIAIPATEIDVTGARTNVIRNIDISKYLPTDVTLAEGTDSNVKVTVEIIPAEEISADKTKSAD